MSWYAYGRKSPSPDFEQDPLAGWNNVSDKNLLATSDLHPSQLGAPRLDEGPYEAAAGKCSWDIPKKPHPLSLLLAQLALPKFCSSSRWVEAKKKVPERTGLTTVKLFSSADGAQLGTIGSMNLDAVQKLSAPSPFGMGSQTVYDEAVRRGKEVRAAQLQVALAQRLGNDRDGAWYFNDIAHQVGRYLFPGARSVKLVLYKLAMYTEGGHFRMHKDTTHADSHVGTVLIGCGVAQDDIPDDEAWDAMDHDFTEHVDGDYTGGDLVILDDDGEQQRYHIRAGQVLAFCTDVPHAVEAVTSGVKLTLQFDVYLEDESVERENTVSCVDLDTWPYFYGLRPGGASSGTPDNGDTKVLVACPSCNHPGCVVVEKRSPSIVWRGYVPAFNEHEDPFASDEHAVTHWAWHDESGPRYPRLTPCDTMDRFIMHLLALLEEALASGSSTDSTRTGAHPAPLPSPTASDDADIQDMLEKREDTPEDPYSVTDSDIATKPTPPPRTVAFLLTHMYRKRSIRPEYLKGADAVIYRALVASKKLRVILHHVTYEVDSSYSHIEVQRLAICPPYAEGFSPRDVTEPVLVLSRPGSGATYLRRLQDDMIEAGELYVGNEALELSSWYVAGTMFVSLL